jgi:hypothetical protein
LYDYIFISPRTVTIWVVGPDGIRDGIRRGIVNPASCPAQTILLGCGYAAGDVVFDLVPVRMTTIRRTVNPVSATLPRIARSRSMSVPIFDGLVRN